MTSPSALAEAIKTDVKALARSLTYVENDQPAGRALLKVIAPDPAIPVIGVTGPPGAGKSTLIEGLAGKLAALGKRVAILAVDPTSPFTLGSLLGDRIRMNRLAVQDGVFIRSLATRGSLGGLSARTVEMTDVLKAAGFQFILVETVGVGQSELEIARLADKTIVVLVPGAGDEVQLIKSGIMEIADAFVVNKADHEGADRLEAGLKKMLHAKETQVPVYKTNAVKGIGLEELIGYILQPMAGIPGRKPFLIAEKAWKLVEAGRMRDLNKEQFSDEVIAESALPGFNVYRFVERYGG